MGDKIFKGNMLIITSKMNRILEEKNLSLYELGKRMNFSDGALHDMINGRRYFSENAINKLLPIIGVQREKFEGWILADKYSKEILELALKARKEKHDDKLILTSKIDEILQNKNLSRTALSKIIDYSQGRLNEIIIGKKPMSKNVLNKLSAALEVPETEIKSWTVADKYSLKVLETAVNVLDDIN